MGITRLVSAVAASLTLAGASATETAAPTPQSVDPSHTRVGFAVRHEKLDGSGYPWGRPTTSWAPSSAS